MKKDEREALRLRVANFYIDTACGNLKTTWNFFKKEGFCYSTIHRIIKRYVQFKTTKDLPRSGRPQELSNKQMKTMELTLNNKSDISHQILSRRYNVHYRTIGRNSQQRTNIRPRKRIEVPKYINGQQTRAQKKWWCFLYR
jgi:transposase